jgi:hypothetical protein
MCVSRLGQRHNAFAIADVVDEINHEFKPAGRLMFHRTTPGFSQDRSCVYGRVLACSFETRGVAGHAEEDKGRSGDFGFS